MMGGPFTEHKGFTIAETLIVLAVTGLILSSALVLVGGRQAETEFNVAVRQAQQQTQQVINEVGSGNYTNQSFLCNRSATPNQPPVIQSGGGTASQQGQRQACIYLGKVLQFSPGTNNDTVNVITLAGNRFGPDGVSEATSLSDAQTIALVQTPAYGAIPTGLTSSYTLTNGLKIVNAYYNNNPAQTVGAAAIVTGLASIANGNVVSGSLSTGLYVINGTSVGQSLVSTANSIDNGLGSTSAASRFKQVDSMSVCYKAGRTNKSGLVTIGGNGGQLTVNLQIFYSQDCT